jgi:hypothetical protein
LFEDPEFFERSSDTQVILLGLILGADDYGRGLAHRGLLARKFNKEPTLIEQALHELEHGGLVQLYQDERQQYYWLTRWHEWETLSKPTPSRYPAPPLTHEMTSPQKTQGNSGHSSHPQGNAGQPRKMLAEEKRNEEEGEGEVKGEQPPTNVVPFPSTHPNAVAIAEQQHLQETTRLVARILKLSESEELRRLVADYLHHPQLSLPGEADAAREWADNRQQNRHGRRLTPAFFRRWLKREVEMLARKAAQRQRIATGTEGSGPTLPTSPSAPTRKSLMSLQAQYQAQMQHGGKP